VAGDPKRSRVWQVEHLWWLGLIAAGFGLLTWAGFAYVGLRSRERIWLAWAAGYLALAVVSLTVVDVSPEDSWQQLVGSFGWLGGWFGGFVHAYALRDRALELLSFDDDPRLKSARSRMLRRQVAAELARRKPKLAMEAGVGQDADTFGGLIDVNHASAAEIAQLPGFTEKLSKKIVEVRESIDGFDSVEDFAHVLDLPQHLVDRIRDRLVCLPR